MYHKLGNELSISRAFSQSLQQPYEIDTISITIL